MPSVSKAQHNFMAAVANNPAFAKKAGVPQSVGKEFSNADKGKTFKRGGDMAKMNAGMMAIMAKKKPAMKMAGGGAMPMKDGKPAFLNDGKGMKKGGMAVKKMAMSGSASTRADGVAVKGKTKGKMMKNGGRTC